MSADAMRKSSRTDWRRVDALTDDTIDTSELPPLTEAFFERATLRQPRRSIAVTVRVDPELYAWLQAQGPDWERHVNAALHEYARAHGSRSA